MTAQEWILSGACPWCSLDEWTALDERGRWQIVKVLSDLLRLEPRREAHRALAVQCGRWPGIN